VFQLSSFTRALGRPARMPSHLPACPPSHTPGLTLPQPASPALPPPNAPCRCCTLSNEAYDVWVAWTVAGVLGFVLALLCTWRSAAAWRQQKVGGVPRAQQA